MTLYIGLMSGTSMDGIDAALIDLPSNQLIYGITKSYSPEVKNHINKIVDSAHHDLPFVCQLNTLIGREFANATNELLHAAQIPSKDVEAIGSHGQTICHDANSNIPYTLQLGCGHTIASLTGITVVADFRTRDLVNGGQGAPFAPLYHHELFVHSDKTIGVLNIGGIANISLIKPNQSPLGWDVGPGNCLMDAWIYKHQGKAYDANGDWAQKGQVINPLLNDLLLDPFFNRPPPKSIGKEYFSLNWLKSHLRNDYTDIDVQATLLALTAHSVAKGIYKTNGLDELYLCGGGVHNKFLCTSLSQLLPEINIQSTMVKSADPDFVEAMMFAWLASRTINKIPVDLSSITGSKGSAILGAIYSY